MILNTGTRGATIPKDLHQSIPPTAFAEGRRPTLAFVVNHQGRLLLVNHVKAPAGEWTLPQEGIKRLETLGQTAIRGLREELGFAQNVSYQMGGSHSRFFKEDFFNPIPADRTVDGKQCVKHTVFFALRARTDRLVLNGKEIRAAAWVNGWEAFRKHTEAHGARRPEKFRAIARVLVSASVPKKDADGRDTENTFFTWGPPPAELVEFLREPDVVAQ